MSSPVDGPLPDGSGAGWYVIATLVSLIAGTSLFAWRAPVLEAFAACLVQWQQRPHLQAIVQLHQKQHRLL